MNEIGKGIATLGICSMVIGVVAFNPAGVVPVCIVAGVVGFFIWVK